MRKIHLAILDDNDLYVEITAARIKEGVMQLNPEVDLSITKFTDPVLFVHRFEHSHFDLVLIDQNMPRLKGSDVVLKLKQSLSNTLFFFVTGFDDDQILEDIIKIPNVIGVYPKSKFVDENIIRTIPLILEKRKCQINKSGVILVLVTIVVFSLTTILSLVFFN